MPDNTMIRNMVETALTLSVWRNAIDQLFDAWSHTRNLRENGGCLDANLAVAEHYLYARYYVAENGSIGWGYMQALITGYNLLKLVGLDGLLPETGKCKVSQFSQIDVDWSFRGSDDGLKDSARGSDKKLRLTSPDLPLRPFEGL